jgi:hypothetical protein
MVTLSPVEAKFSNSSSIEIKVLAKESFCSSDTFGVEERTVKNINPIINRNIVGRYKNSLEEDLLRSNLFSGIKNVCKV